MSENVQEYGIRFSVDSDAVKLNNLKFSISGFKQTLGGLTDTFLKLSAVGGLSTFGMFKGFDALRETALGLSAISKASDISIEKLTKMGYVLDKGINTTGSVKKVMAFTNSSKMLGRELTSLRNAVFMTAVPTLTKMVEGVNDAFANNRSSIIAGVEAIGEVVQRVGGAIKNATVLILDLIKSLNLSTTAVNVLKGAGLVLGGALGAIFAPWTTTIVALIALLDDLKNYKEGKGSVTASVVDFYKKNIDKTEARANIQRLLEADKSEPPKPTNVTINFNNAKFTGTPKENADEIMLAWVSAAQSNNFAS